MGGMIPLRDASRRPASVPVVTAGIIVINAAVFVLELLRRRNLRDAVVRDSRADCLRPSLDHYSDSDVHRSVIVFGPCPQRGCRKARH